MQRVVQEILDELVGTGAGLGVQVAAFVDGEQRAAAGPGATHPGLAPAVAKSVISHDFDTLTRPGWRRGNDDLYSFTTRCAVDATRSRHRRLYRCSSGAGERTEPT